MNKIQNIKLIFTLSIIMLMGNSHAEIDWKSYGSWRNIYKIIYLDSDSLILYEDYIGISKVNLKTGNVSLIKKAFAIEMGLPTLLPVFKKGYRITINTGRDFVTHDTVAKENRLDWQRCEGAANKFSNRYIDLMTVDPAGFDLALVSRYPTSGNNNDTTGLAFFKHTALNTWVEVYTHTNTYKVMKSGVRTYPQQMAFAKNGDLLVNISSPDTSVHGLYSVNESSMTRLTKDLLIDLHKAGNGDLFIQSFKDSSSLKANDGSLWSYTASGFQKLAPKSPKFNQSALAANLIGVDGEGSMCFTSGNFVGWLKGSQWTEVTLEKMGMLDALPSTVSVSPQAGIWYIETRMGVLLHFDGSQVKTIPLIKESKFFTDTLTTMALDKSNNLWVGSAKGLTSINSKSTRNFLSYNTPVPSNKILKIPPTPEGKVAVLTAMGLAQCSDSSCQAVPITNRCGETAGVDLLANKAEQFAGFAVLPNGDWVLALKASGIGPCKSGSDCSRLVKFKPGACATPINGDLPNGYNSLAASSTGYTLVSHSSGVYKIEDNNLVKVNEQPLELFSGYESVWGRTNRNSEPIIEFSAKGRTEWSVARTKLPMASFVPIGWDAQGNTWMENEDQILARHKGSLFTLIKQFDMNYEPQYLEQIIFDPSGYLYAIGPKGLMISTVPVKTEEVTRVKNKNKINNPLRFRFNLSGRKS